MLSKNFTPYICIISHSHVHIPHHYEQITTCHPPNRLLEPQEESHPCTLLSSVGTYTCIYIDSFCIHSFTSISSKYWSYCTSTTLQLFNSSTTEFQQLKLAFVCGYEKGTKMIRGPNSATKLVPGGTNLVAVLVLGDPTRWGVNIGMTSQLSHGPYGG